MYNTDSEVIRLNNFQTGRQNSFIKSEPSSRRFKIVRSPSFRSRAKQQNRKLPSKNNKALMRSNLLNAPLFTGSSRAAAAAAAVGESKMYKRKSGRKRKKEESSFSSAAGSLTPTSPR